MKLIELEIGKEYAADKHCDARYAGSYKPVRVRLLDVVRREGPAQYRLGRRIPMTKHLAKVELLEPWGARHDDKVAGSAGSIWELPPRNIWWPWEQEQAERAAREEQAGRRRIVKDRILAALTILGLHHERYLGQLDTIEEAKVSVSGAELEKLARRAEHLVLLERIVHEQWTNDPVAEDGTGHMGQEILAWAEVHDFSGLEEAAGSSS